MVFALTWGTTTISLPQWSFHGCRQLNKKCLAVIFSLLLLTLGISSPLWHMAGGWMAREVSGHQGLEEEDFRLTTAEQVHLALGPSPTQMTVIWATKAYTRSWILYGYDTESLDKKQVGTVEYVLYKNTQGTPYWHRVMLSGLEPGRVYYYRIKSGKHISRPFKFTTLRAGHDWSPRFMVYGDFGAKTRGFEKIIKEGRVGHYNAVLHLGDIAYNLAHNQGQVGDHFLDWLQSLASEVPYMTCPGDHETPDKFWHYGFRFSMPSASWPMPSNSLWYSIDIGNVHLISFNSEVFFYDPANIQSQIDWLISDLEKANQKRAEIPWIIVMGHKPMYCSYSHSQDCNNPNSVLRAALEEMFHVYGVDLYLSGHCHLYERTWPVYHGQAMAKNYYNPRGMVQIITGTTGNQYAVDSVNLLVRNQWSGFLMSKRDWESYGRLTILNNTHLVWEEVMAKSSKVIDYFVVEQHTHGSFGDLPAFRRSYFLYSITRTLLGFVPNRQVSVLLLLLAIVIYLMNKRWGFVVFRIAGSAVSFNGMKKANSVDV